jgi:hypothetical protein
MKVQLAPITATTTMSKRISDTRICSGVRSSARFFGFGGIVHEKLSRRQGKLTRNGCTKKRDHSEFDPVAL